jgi:hypothetical protein
MASETGKGDLSELEEKCGKDDFICAQRIFYAKDKSHFIECESSAETKTKCHTPESYVESFFKIIDPEKLYNEFNKGPNSIISAFVAELNNKLKQNETVKKELTSVYGVDVTSLDNILSEYVPRETNDQDLCHDIIGNVCLNTTPKSNSIFHISIHPKTSRCVIIGNRKNRIASCGYFEKLATEGSGAFHYKIDTDPSDKDKPFKKLINATDGTFSENPIPFARKGEKETDSTNAKLYKLHNFFYEEFRKFWNNIITERTRDIFNTTTSETSESLTLPNVRGKSARKEHPTEPSIEPQRQRSQKDPDPVPVPDPDPDPDQPPEILGGDKRIRRKTNKKRKTIKKRKTKKRKTIKMKPIKKRKTSKR